MDTEEQITNLAEAFQALSDPNRLRILEMLTSSSHPICVNGLARRLEISQSAVSQHLKVLRNAGLVTDRKEGYFRHYSVNEDRFRDLKKMRAAVLGRELKL